MSRVWIRTERVSYSQRGKQKLTVSWFKFSTTLNLITPLFFLKKKDKVTDSTHMQNNFLLPSQFHWALSIWHRENSSLQMQKLKIYLYNSRLCKWGPHNVKYLIALWARIPEVTINSCPLYFASSRVPVSVLDSAQKHNIWGIFWIENLSWWIGILSNTSQAGKQTFCNNSDGPLWQVNLKI